MPRKRGPLVKRGLLLKSREAALNAVQTFNNPLTTFKAETFIVLMNIAWMYLLHAYYRQEGIEYRYYRKGLPTPNVNRTKSGAFKYWDLERCLKDDTCPLDGPTKHNLRFLIGLRNEIEHQASLLGSARAFWTLLCMLSELMNAMYASCLASATHWARLLPSLSSFETSLPRGRGPKSPRPLPSSVAKYVQELQY